MKINVACGCGSTFQAPEHLLGQTVKCPSCGKPLTITAGPEQSDAGGVPHADSFDVNDLSALDQTSISDATAHGSTLGRSAIRPGRRGGSTMGGKAIKEQPADADTGITQELDDRMKRMYEVYSGKQMRFGGGSGGKLKLLIGLGIAAVVIAGGLGVGWQVLKSEYQPALDSARGLVTGESQADETQADVPKGPRAQRPDAMADWQAPASGQVSGVSLSLISVQADSTDPKRFGFNVKIVPASLASDRRLSMSTSVILYRGLSAQGPFTQADRVTVEDFDQASGALGFEVYDSDLSGLKTNELYYRLSGFDSEGDRLFDTPAATFAYLDPPKVKLGRVTWDPRAADHAAPALRVQARLDAPGWEGVLLWQILAAGPIDQLMPDLPSGLPIVIESSVYTPQAIELDSQGRGRWQRVWAAKEIDRRGKPGSEVVGAAPYAVGDRLDARLTPNETSFASVSLSWDPSTQNRRVGTLRFTPESGRPQALTLDSPPVLENIWATAYDGQILLSWDSKALLAGLNRYESEIGIEVRRVTAEGEVARIAQLPADAEHFIDETVENGQRVSYEIRLIQAGINGADPVVRADAWVQGHGLLAVLAAYPFEEQTAWVSPESGLSKLHVSIGLSELAYSNTGLPGVQIRNQLVALLSQIQSVVVIDRASLQGFFLADHAVSIAQSLRQAGGAPAQVQLRLVDSTTNQGERLALWATDIASGRTTLLAEADAGGAADHADAFINALGTYIEPRLPKATPDEPGPGEAPRHVVVGPIYPVDQLELFYGSEALVEQLAQAGDLAQPDLPVVTRGFWMSDTRQAPDRIDTSALQGAVIITGRAWSGEDALPGVSLRAIDAATGELIDRFDTERLTPQSVRDFAEFCGTLRVRGGAIANAGSPLVKAEQTLLEIHPVWLEHSSTASDDSGMSLFSNGDESSGAGRPVLSFGLALPASLTGQEGVTFLDPDHPLSALRPYLAPQHPLSFDRWAQVYADYLEADSTAFIRGFDQVRRAQQAKPGPVKPHLMIRGEHKFTGEDTIPAGAGGYRVTPAAICVRSFFPMGAGGQPMIDYRHDLSQQFKQHPWASYHAWKQVKRGIAEPFIKGELFGVREGTYDRLVYPEKPAPLSSFAAAKLLARMGLGAAASYEKKAKITAALALKELIAGGAGGLSNEETKWATDALLVLAFERDPGVIEQLSNPGFRKRYLKVESDAQTDVLRMLVDQVGPKAWDWAGDFESVDWSTFLWRSADEMDRVTRAKSDLIPQDTLEGLRAWLDVETSNGATDSNAPDLGTATGPASTPRTP